MDSTADWITTTEAVRITGLSEAMLRKMAREGKLERQSGGRGRSAHFNKAQIQALAKQREEKEINERN